ncbi:unnamed protein product [Coffea canephora]|uniref:non-specific serine/threonine protein kinase n=1 Tax=Coffea canephora TaxID=49390 RepID=A0A068VFM8_COFCA|nr:unnamed protein product [Coffea canephora]
MWGFRSSSTLANIFLLLLVAMNLSVSHVSASKQFQNETDRLALLEFKNQIYDDPFGVLNSWNHSQHHCHWEGVTCSARHQRVMALTLRNKHLSGTISPHVGNLSFMRFMELRGNQFQGEIPQEFGRLSRLRALNLSHNAISGKIPVNLSYCLELINISLVGNNLEGKIPIDQLSNLKKLEIFYLGQNNLTGEIPSSIGNLSSLTGLTFDFNHLEGNLPMEMGLLRRLAVFVAAENNLSGILPASIFNSSAANFFQGTIPPNLASLKSIQQIDLSSNNLTGSIPKELEKLQYLRYLNLSYNDIEGEVPNTGIFSNASQMSLIGNNKLCGGIPELEFPPCPVIKGKNRGKLKVIILLSIVLSATLVVLGTVLLYLLVYRKRERRLVAGFSSMPTRVNKLLRISYHELHRATSGFSPENLIVLDLQKNGASKSFKAESKTLRNIRHRNLVSIMSCCSSIDSKGDEFKALVYEFMENGNLDLWLHPSETTAQGTSSRSLNLSQKLNIAIDVASALQYLHDHCEAEIVHCDLKPSNILLDNDLVAHVGDFGLARLLPKPNNRSSEQGTSSSIAVKGSIGYAAPEYGMGHAASTPGDVYSYGILLLEMITKRRPTDDMFMDDLDIHNYVNRALHEQVSEIVDPLLLFEGRDENRRITHGEETINGGRQIHCIISLLKIGLKCSAKLPNDRMHMNEVVRNLHLIKDVLLGLRVHRENLQV